MSEFKIEQATRLGVVPLIDVVGESGTGKTMSALLLARGIAGDKGEIVGIDTENRRMSLYADVIPGGFKVVDLAEPYSPDRYIDAMKVALSGNPACIVIDSASHEHEGAGGILDMATKNEEESKRAGLHNWRKPKFEHAKFVQFMLRCPVPVICCIRAKYKTRQKKGTQQMFDRGEIERFQIGKTIIEKDANVSPIQSEDFLFDATAHFVVTQDHTIVLYKASHPDLRKCFPADRTTPITIEHGKMIASWCKAGGQLPATATAGATAKPILSDEDKERKALATSVWNLFKAKRPELVAQSNWQAINAWAYKNEIFDGALESPEAFPHITIARFKEIIPKLEVKL